MDLLVPLVAVGDIIHPAKDQDWLDAETDVEQGLTEGRDRTWSCMLQGLEQSYSVNARPASSLSVCLSVRLSVRILFRGDLA